MLTLAETERVPLQLKGWEIKTLVATKRGEEWSVRETDLLERERTASR